MKVGKKIIETAPPSRFDPRAGVQEAILEILLEEKLQWAPKGPFQSIYSAVWMCGETAGAACIGN